MVKLSFWILTVMVSVSRYKIIQRHFQIVDR